MEWLMLKAKGVGRGILSSSSSYQVHSSSPPRTASALSLSPTYILWDPSVSSHHNFLTTPATSASSSGPGGDQEQVNEEFSYLHPQMTQLQLNVSTDLHRLMEPHPLLDVNEWVATHIVGLVGNVCSLWDAIYELCDCQSMSGPASLVLVFSQEGGPVPSSAPPSASPSVSSKQKSQSTVRPSYSSSPNSLNTYSLHSPATGACWSTHCAKGSSPPARQYIEACLHSCHALLSPQSSPLFPTRYGEAFPQDFLFHCATICRRLFHCLVHFYGAHFALFHELDMVVYLNTVCRHWLLLNAHFNFLDERELEVFAGLHTLLLTATPTETFHTNEHDPGTWNGDVQK